MSPIGDELDPKQPGQERRFRRLETRVLELEDAQANKAAANAITSAAANVNTPPIIANLILSAGADYVYAHWNPTDLVVPHYYECEIDPVSTFADAVTGKIGAENVRRTGETFMRFTGLDAARIYNVRVRAVRTAGEVFGAWTASASATTGVNSGSRVHSWISDGI